MIQTIQNEAKTRMQKCVETLKTGLSKIRTGRAAPGLLEPIMVDYYGQSTPLKQVASVNVEDARTLLVAPWDKSAIKAIEKAILTADLGLNPVSSNDGIRVPMPALTEDRRKELGKIVKNEAEQARIAVRNIRRDANAEFKTLLKDKAITEDESHRAEEAIQKLTDSVITEIDKMASTKEADLMEI